MHRLLATSTDLVALTIALVAGAVVGVIGGLQTTTIRIEGIAIVSVVVTLAVAALVKLRATRSVTDGPGTRLR